MVHLVVLVHGLWGMSSHMDYLRKALEQQEEDYYSEDEKEGNEELVIYATRANEGYKTYDGIDICGFRVAKEIEEQIVQLCGNVGDYQLNSNCEPRVHKFSLVGYSLGGLIGRYALGLLYGKQVFEKYGIKLLNFTTFCSPHVGVLAPGKNLAVNLFNKICPLTLGNSGKHIFLKDSVTSADGVPLLYLMSREHSVFYRVLSEFKYRSLYANVINDKRTAWWTAGISLNDPFFDLTQFNGIDRFKYIEGYEPVVINGVQSLINLYPIKEDDFEEREEATSYDEKEMLADGCYSVASDQREFFFINYWGSKLYRWMKVLTNICVIAPLWIIWFILTSFYHTINSTVRVTKFVNKYSHQFMYDYFVVGSQIITPCSSRDTTECDMVTDSFICDNISVETNPQIDLGTSTEISSSVPIIDHLANRIVSSSSFPRTEYQAQIEQSLQDQADTLIESVYEAIERRETLTGFTSANEPVSFTVTIKDLESKRIEDMEVQDEEQRNLLENCRLRLSPIQLEIIDSLNKLGWMKYPIYIRKTASSHACSIVRHPDPNFSEGEIVVKHWCKEVFKFA